MNEISVIVNQTPGEVTWNFEDIKSFLRDQLVTYRNMIYTDESIKTAKTDLADLRKLAKAIEARRVEIKNRCLEPYQLIEDQAKELVALVEEPIKAINDQVLDYERRRMESAKTEITEYFKSKAESLPEELRRKVFGKYFSKSWLNATATKKTWKEGIDGGIQRTLSDLDSIRSFKSEYEADVMKVYYDTLDLSAAIRKLQSMNAQRERILEMERRKKEEAERRAAAEAARAEEEKRRAAEEAARRAEEAKKPLPEDKPRAEDIEPRKAAFMAEQKQAAEKLEDPPVNCEPPKPPTVMTTLELVGTAYQINKVIGYAKYIGVAVTEVQV